MNGIIGNNRISCVLQFLWCILPFIFLTYLTILNQDSLLEYRLHKRTCNKTSKINIHNRQYKPYYVTILCGDGRRLGNLMFSYGSLLGISEITRLSPVLKTDFQLYDVFKNLSVPQHGKLAGPSKNFYERTACGFDSKVANLGYIDNNITLSGFYQSWKYFENIKDLIRKEFQFKKKIVSQAQSTHSILRNSLNMTSDVISVGIHVRRGDMLSNRSVKFGYTVADKAYFQQAMDYFRQKFKNLMFIVSGNDMKWCRENINGKHVTYTSGTDPVLDLAVLSTCHHVIISTGSFGWWGAWLANGTTIYYSKWPRPKSGLDNHVIHEDYFPKNWIPMP